VTDDELDAEIEAEIRRTAEFYREIRRRDTALEAARKKLKRKGRTAPEDTERYQQVATDYAEWRRAIRALDGRRGTAPGNANPDMATGEGTGG
jgi:hypothetical protein